jgi:AcrR family transcriptional regulator
MKPARARPSIPRPVPRDSEYADRKRQILDNARVVFTRYGYRKTTIEDIGRACGLGKAALYHYFSGKQEIFAEIVRDETGRLLAKIREAVDAARDPRAKLVAALTTSFKAASDRIAELVEQKSAAELKAQLPLAARNLQRFLDEEVAILREILDEGARKGVFKKINSPSAPLLIIAGLRGVQLHLLDAENPPKLDDAIDALMKIFLEGICR